MKEISELVQNMLTDERQALARLLSVAERGDSRLLEIEDCISDHVGRAYVIGITGPPGAGKSTLISALLPHVVDTCGKVSVVAVDPSSPISGGAILGDRIRMQAPEQASNLFFRSMASRGQLGGLARTASTAVRLLDAAGWPIVFIETVGIGQVELDIMDLADTVVVVLNPGWGDEIQASKAGLTEVGDIFVINKADRPGVRQTRKDLLDSFSLIPATNRPPVLEAVSNAGDGISEVWQSIDDRRTEQEGSDQLLQQRQRKRQRLVVKVLEQQMMRTIRETMASEEAMELLKDASLGELNMKDTLRQVLSLVDRF